MADKAVLITERNIAYLTERFVGEEDDRTPLAVGYILVTMFNSNDQQDYDLLTREEFKKIWIPTGTLLQNGFFEVKRRIIRDVFRRLFTKNFT